MLQNERNEDVESFADGLEHDKVERNASQRVQHAEYLAAWCLRRAVTVT